MASTKRNYYQEKEWRPLKGIISTKPNDVQLEEWLPLKATAFTTRNRFH